MEEQTSTCKFLLQAGANPQETDQIDRSPIDIVWNMMVREGRTERFRALIEIFKLDIEDGFDYLMTRKYTPLHQIIMGLKTHPSHDTNSLLALQLDFSRDEIDAQDTQGRTPLHWAVTRANAGAVRLLLAAGASIKLRDYKKQTPIHLCATVEWARVDCLAPLLFVAAQREWEERIRVRPRQRDGALLVQSQFNSVIWKSKLLDDNNDYQGRTPALLAAYNDGDDKLDLLLRHHADIEITDFQGRTPLLFAIFRESVKCVGLLLAHDARTDAVDKHNSTILHYAARFGTLEILQLLRDGVHGVDVCARDKDGNTALDIFTNHRPKAPSPEESFTFKQLLEKSVLPKLTQPVIVPVLLSTEDGENSDLEQFFTAASSMEASRVNSLENSVEDIRTIDAERSGRLFFVPAIKQWVHKML
ncbi:putative ankyrin repeat protein [Phaeoacremonium minimum UCRPA7]|uniref:Putative ankyrin repeat protein n=1 Tax=Phaeoacremonium minimum (strain UCR-PA7) TaxID=1286976 RepID=R8BHZ8_PHAM7|nr:putative ankyrin repeat protein [Phaeoacremonium minimum UCRPA7]EON98965.1 putative ankyrin repeat protein [Phaeoacremonium minimum UCRPA7]